MIVVYNKRGVNAKSVRKTYAMTGQGQQE